MVIWYEIQDISHSTTVTYAKRWPELMRLTKDTNPDRKVHGANMRPTWVLSAPDGPHVGPMNFVIREILAMGGYSLLASLSNSIMNPAMVSTVRFYDRNELYGSPDVRNCRMPNFLGWAFFGKCFWGDGRHCRTAWQRCQIIDPTDVHGHLRWATISRWGTWWCRDMTQ